MVLFQLMAQEKGKKISIQVKIVGPIDGRSVALSGTVELRQGDSIKKLLKKADTLAETKEIKPFKKAFRQGADPILLLNGERIDLSEGKDRTLKHGDQVSVIVAIAGG